MVAFGYLCLGLLVGVLAGLSSSPIAATLLAALFTFAGGSAAHMIGQKPADRRLIGTILSSFTAACLLGLCGGIVIKENRLFTSSTRLAQMLVLEHKLAGTPAATAKSEVQPATALFTPYLKTGQIDAIRDIHVKYVNRELTPDQAYNQLRLVLERSDVP